MYPYVVVKNIISCRMSMSSRIDQRQQGHQIFDPSHLGPAVAAALTSTDGSFFEIPAAIFLQKQVSSATISGKNRGAGDG